METKLCRICGRLGTTHQDIFKLEGLIHKIETCLPIFVTQHCLLPDTICDECLENITKFYHFIKNCLQNIIILESQYDVTESCLKSRRKHDKSCLVNISEHNKAKETQTDDTYDILFTKYEENSKNVKLPIHGCDKNLVAYEVDSDNSEPENDSPNRGVVLVNRRNNKKIDDLLSDLLNKTPFTKQYFDNFENNIINEITHRRAVKRKLETIENDPMKIFKVDSGNRRKNKVPKKFPSNISFQNNGISDFVQESNQAEINDKKIGNHLGIASSQSITTLDPILPQNCLLCDEKLCGPAELATHVFEIHNLDLNKTMENFSDKKKKIPNLLKISDIKRNSSSDDNPYDSSSPQNHQADFSCHICTYSSLTKKDLYHHCQSEHSAEVPLMCGICFQPMTSLVNLRNHLKICAIEYPVKTRYFCTICKYGEDGMREMENHVLIHEFLKDRCNKEVRMFDPADYVELNYSCEFGPVSPSSKNLSCSLCFQSNFQSFEDFSNHRRKQHSKFHCDLCNKFYGRNSHLWKHVNRLHKNHPSITCQICQKTSASKYHLGQHFSKIHSSKHTKNTNDMLNTDDMNFELGNDHSVFGKYDFMKREKKSTSSEFDDISNNAASDQDMLDEVFAANVPVPKEVDASSHLYTNIITNYTPPPNGGDFKCPKCSKGFSKKILLKKHKKNCRPKLQKDLLTRCKSCARIFKDRQSLAKHLVNYHSEYTCEICSQKTQSKCEIVSHIRFTHPKCKLFCKICGTILRSQQNLADHINDHSNSYVCQFCGDSLPSKIKLKMHILSLHRKILSLSCGICLKLFENQHILKDHVQLVHKNDLRPLTSCTVCGKNYGSKWKTYDHLNKSHGRIFKVCKTCLEVFNSEEELNLHCEEMHSLNNQNISSIKQSTYVKQEAEEIDESESCKEEMEGVEEIDQPSDETFNNFTPDISAVKISMLEKRLMGKKIEKEDTCPKLEENKTSEEQPKFLSIKSKLATTKKSANSPRYEYDVAQQSSSKRTVYVNSDVPSLCEICFKTWPAKKHLWQHYIRCHKSVAATVCGICLKTNVDYVTLQEHLKQNHPTLLHGQGFGSNFICRVCGRYHNASSKLKLHMAIHENFNWSILETTNDGEKMLQRTEDNETYFESLIEQVECSSNEDEETEDEHKVEKEGNDDSSSSEINDSDSDSISEDSNRNQNDTKQHYRNNSSENYGEGDMINKNNECSQVTTEFQSTESDNSSSESCSSEDEDTVGGNEERSNTTSSNEVLIVNGFTNSSSNAIVVNSMGDSLPFDDSGLLGFKTEELDSAVKSISLECGTQVKEDSDIEYCELSMGTALNDGEIESAVGSIL
ncbi:zinc finger protein 729-like [Harmonia axyridis]|uniref:zinc finger protein 729-like n=1 Tax=Harmonia axyridis TaxID=115357 RepID=UPI001E2787F0|nr:zinc finger protein 729-like [Harmonia axyridis]